MTHWEPPVIQFLDSPLYSCGTTHSESACERLEHSWVSCQWIRGMSNGFHGKKPDPMAVRRGPVNSVRAQWRRRGPAGVMECLRRCLSSSNCNNINKISSCPLRLQQYQHRFSAHQASIMLCKWERVACGTVRGCQIPSHNFTTLARSQTREKKALMLKDVSAGAVLHQMDPNATWMRSHLSGSQPAEGCHWTKVVASLQPPSSL